MLTVELSVCLFVGRSVGMLLTCADGSTSLIKSSTPRGIARSYIIIWNRGGGGKIDIEYGIFFVI